MNKFADFKSEVEKYAEDCHDAVAALRSLTFDDRSVSFETTNGLFPGAKESGVLNDWAAQQIGSRLDAPGAEWLWAEKHCYPALRSSILNDLAQNRPEANYFIRSKGDTVRAILSDQFTKFDNKDIVGLVETAIETMGMEPLIKRSNVADDLSAYVLFPQVTVTNDPRSRGGSDGQLHPAIHISNSERGNGSAKITGAVFSGYCQNGLIYGWRSNEIMAVRHRFISMATMGALVAQSIAIGLEMSEAAAVAFVQSQEIKIPKVDLSNIVDGWAKKYGLSIDQKENWLGAITGELSRNERPDDPRVFDLVNGATWYAQELPVADSVQIERMAGDLLTAYVPLPRSER
jgi:hypothetical protein